MKTQEMSNASPMPFGGESCEDDTIATVLASFGKMSPMPFGGESCEDEHSTKYTASVYHVTNAFRRGVL